MTEVSSNSISEHMKSERCFHILYESIWTTVSIAEPMMRSKCESFLLNLAYILCALNRTRSTTSTSGSVASYPLEDNAPDAHQTCLQHLGDCSILALVDEVQPTAGRLIEQCQRLISEWNTSSPCSCFLGFTVRLRAMTVDRVI